jgi:uroporphyrinogen decarboxylase
MQTALNFEIPDRVSFCDSFWPETERAWWEQGLPGDVSALDYFDVDWRSLSLDTTFRLPEEILEDTENYLLVRNGDGMTARCLKGVSTTPGFVDWLIKTEQDWQEYKPLLVPDRTRLSPWVLYAFNDSFKPPQRSWDQIVPAYQQLRDSGRFLSLTVYDPWENLWRKIGVEQGLVAMATEPQWVQDMSATHTRLILESIEMIWNEGVRLDGVMLVGDFASFKSMLFSPGMYREFIFPYHKQLCEFFNALDVPVIFHCCGHVIPVIPDLIEAGFRALQPLSCRSGLELSHLKKEYGRRIVLMGNVSAVALAAGGETLEREVHNKMLAGKPGGGYVYHSDHSIPPEVLFSEYQRVAEMVKELGRYD